MLFPVFSLHKQLAVTDTAAAPEPVLLSLNSSKSDLPVIIAHI